MKSSIPPRLERVHDLTPRGAGLSVISSFGVPRSFQLAVDGETVMRHCKPRRQRFAGFCFSGGCNPHDGQSNR
jgi:hypothetical protein